MSCWRGLRSIDNIPLPTAPMYMYIFHHPYPLYYVYLHSPRYSPPLVSPCSSLIPPSLVLTPLPLPPTLSNIPPARSDSDFEKSPYRHSLVSAAVPRTAARDMRANASLRPYPNPAHAASNLLRATCLRYHLIPTPHPSDAITSRTQSTLMYVRCPAAKRTSSCT